MSDEQRPRQLINPELANELADTAATFTRLGVTLVNLPLAMIPDEQRRNIRQVADEVFRMGATLPRTVTSMLEDRQDNSEEARESLGERLRREEAAQAKSDDDLS